MNDLHKKIKSEYIKESLPIRLVFMIILTAASIFSFLTNNALTMTIGCLLAVIDLIFILSSIVCLHLTR